MKRQAIETSEKELFEIANKLKQDRLKIINTNVRYEEDQKTLVPIINKTGNSDDWKFE